MKISQQFSKLLSGLYFQTEIFKEHNSLKNIGRVMVLNLCTSSYDAIYLVTFVQSFIKIFSTAFKLQSGHNYHWENFKGE